MKLVVTVVDDKDDSKLMAALTEQHFSVTRMSSTGGLLGPGNATLLIGVDDGQVPQVMKVIADVASLRQSFVSYSYGGSPLANSIAEVQTGGFLSFVLHIDHFEQV